MQVHPDILKVLRQEILPYIIRIRDFDTPWPAEFWIDGCRQHQNGVVMFNINDRGFLHAEYFGYDALRSYRYPPGMVDAKLIMADTQAEISTNYVSSNLKSSTVLGGFGMPYMESYSCEINGWLGGSNDTKMQAAHMTFLVLTNLHLPRSGSNVTPDDHGSIAFPGATAGKATLKLNAGDWNIQLTESDLNLVHETELLYHAILTRQDGDPFTLNDGHILDAFCDFLSFQVGKWITVPSILCEPVDSINWAVERARIGKLTSGATLARRSSWTASDRLTWPAQFEEFWNQYTALDSRRHLKNAVYHYVEAQQVLDNGSIGQALVSAQSTLQALTRWWNDLKPEARFEPWDAGHFKPSLINAVNKADLGKDTKMVINKEALNATLEEATKYRNDIDHGRGGNVEGQGQSVADYWLHHQNLARLLILAKLGTRDSYARSFPRGPEFTERSQLADNRPLCGH